MGSSFALSDPVEGTLAPYLSSSLFRSDLACSSIPLPLAVPSPLCLTRRGTAVAWSARSVSAYLALLQRSRPPRRAGMLAADRRAGRGETAGLLTPPAVCLGSPPFVREPQSHLM